VLLALVDAGMSREDAYAVVQSAAMRAMDGDGGFRANLEADTAIREKLADIGSLFDPEHYLRNIDVVFDRLSLGVPK
jgi:adenylosuccinate lyase